MGTLYDTMPLSIQSPFDGFSFLHSFFKQKALLLNLNKNSIINPFKIMFLNVIAT